ncbi:MAG: glycosyltransferase [Methanobacterium sp.]|nr:glycosyltransferase [Methanobacterium sp.]
MDSLPYSERLNRAADSANGEYLVFIDGKIRTSQDWLNNLMDVALKTPNIGCVGGKIVYSELGSSSEKSKLYKIRSIGTEFIQTSDGSFKEVPMGNGLELSSPVCLKSNARASISNEVILIPKNRFLEFNGFDEEYLENFQVSDLCLKLTKKGYKNIYHPNSLLFIAIQNEPDFNKKIYSADSKLFNNNWREFLAKNVLLDKIEGRNIYSIEKFKLGFAVSEVGENASAGDYFTAKEFGESLKSMGWEVKFLAREGSDYWYDASNLDVVVSLLYTFDPRRIRSSTASPIKVAWPRNWFDRWVFFPWFSSYDLVFTPSKKSQEYVRLNSTQDPFLLPLATNPSRFNMNVTKNDKYMSDYCFTGSYWNDPREIIDILDPSELPYRFRLFGKNWDEIAKFKPYFGGFVNYSDIPHVYASTKIVVDDANRATKVYGSVNSRVYDALSSGALVLTNGRQGAEEIFMGMLPVYESKADLNNLLEHFLEKDDEREELIEKLQKFVLKNHTYLNRAEELKHKLIKYVEAK